LPKLEIQSYCKEEEDPWVLKERMEKKNPKIDPRAGDSANAEENKNDMKESKTNKTKENKTEKKSATSS